MSGSPWRRRALSLLPPPPADRPPPFAAVAVVVAAVVALCLAAAPLPAAALQEGLAYAPPVAAEEAPGRADSSATFAGRVVSAEDGAPLAGVRVTLRTSGATTSTNAAGQFALEDVPPGVELIDVSLVGYADATVPLLLRMGHTTTATVRLAVEAVRMDEITVTVKSGWRLVKGGFWERLRLGLGTFFTPEDIQRLRPNRPSDLLRTLPGVVVAAARRGRAEIRMRRAAANRSCPPSLFVDGRFARHMRLDDLNRNDVIALEVYRGPSETPAEFIRDAGPAACGAIVAWTRIRGSLASGA